MKLRKLKRKKKAPQLRRNAPASPMLEEEVRQGMYLLQTGDMPQAEICFRRVLSQAPTHAHSLHMLGIIALKSGYFKEAAELIKKSLRHDTDQPGCYNNLGMISIELGDREKAAEYFDKALEKEPDFFEALLNRGNNLRKLKKSEDALPSLERAVELWPKEPMVHYGIGSVLRNLERYDEAIESFRKALDIDPNYGEAHYRLGTAFQGKELFDEAGRSFERALELDQAQEKAIYRLTFCRKFTEDDATIIAQGEKALERENLPKKARTEIHFGLGKAYNDLKKFNKSFAHYGKGNVLKNETGEFNPDSARKLTDGLIKLYSKEHFSNLTFAGNPSTLPVFIVGMPRSGTTLTEQILSRHSLVHGAGELATIRNLVRELFPSELADDDTMEGQETTTLETLKVLRNADGSTFSRMAEKYLDKIEELRIPTDLRVTDKLPHNFQMVGLITTLFPNAKIIHCRRHPLDTCLSIYFQYFAASHPYAYDFNNLAFAYREYQRLMVHWRKALPIPMLEVDYEETVSDIEGVSKKLIDFIGLDWEEECLTFHKSNRLTKTASSWQVKQPIYTSSKQRWKNYEQFIGPLKNALNLEET